MLDLDWLQGANCLGVTAGAAVPESVLSAVIAQIASFFGDDFEVEELPGTLEKMHFPLPSKLTEDHRNA